MTRPRARFGPADLWFYGPPPRTPDKRRGGGPKRVARRGLRARGGAAGYCSLYFSMMASTSRAESTRYSSPWYFTSVPPYLLYSTTSPTLTSIGTRLAPASS